MRGDRTNPFSPDFGQSPVRLVGRTQMLKRMRTAFSEGPRNPDYTTLLLGPRGSGKTAMLTELEDICAAEGWVVVALNASTAELPHRIKNALAPARDTHEAVEQAHPDHGRASRVSGWGSVPFLSGMRSLKR